MKGDHSVRRASVFLLGFVRAEDLYLYWAGRLAQTLTRTLNGVAESGVVEESAAE